MIKNSHTVLVQGDQGLVLRQFREGVDQGSDNREWKEPPPGSKLEYVNPYACIKEMSQGARNRLICWKEED